MPACHAGDRGFESRQLRHFFWMAAVAKWLTHRIVAPAFVGSIPTGRPICGSGSGVEHRLAKARVAGSNPVFRSNIDHE